MAGDAVVAEDAPQAVYHARPRFAEPDRRNRGE